MNIPILLRDYKQGVVIIVGQPASQGYSAKFFIKLRDFQEIMNMTIDYEKTTIVLYLFLRRLSSFYFKN